MPQLKKSLGLIYAVNPFGADHMSSEHDAAYEGAYQYYRKRLTVLGLEEPQPSRSLNREKIRFARKTQYMYSMADSLNLCHFVWGASWHLYGPEKIVKLDQVEFETAKEEYYRQSGWDVTSGLPTPQTLDRLGLEWTTTCQ